MKPTVSIVIATYQGVEFIEGWTASLAAQTYPLHEIIIIDNSIDTATYEALQQVRAVQLRIFPQQHNLDFAQGYNLGMRKATGDYICILNQDITVEPDAIERLVEYLESNQRVAAASPALLRFGSTPDKPIIDSLGISLSRFRIYKNIGEGKSVPLPKAPHEVFALTGAAICFRATALQELYARDQEYFDADFVAYKEDIDISYRLRHLGYTLSIVPQSVMYHRRTAQELAHVSMREARAQKSFRIRGNSLKNQWWVLLKNEPWSTLCIHGIYMGIIECARLAYIVCCEPSTLRILPRALHEFPRMIRKRRRIQRHSHLTFSALRSWIS